ncbi:MAG: hypothetical protein MI746_18255 [Pseudomonadales bacterium]|nr:hypothetical protein [Pseudomonadales bacterium]
MRNSNLRLGSLLIAALAVTSAPSIRADTINATANDAELAAFDIVTASISIENNTAIFNMAVSGAAGTSTPAASGKLAGSEVFSYVWPTTINSYEVGFEQDAGILALAVTSHADFDDTPLYDENGDSDPGNDGEVWHSHWVVLQPNESCGPGALGVVDIPADSQPRLPKTWPGLPILLDSPGWDPLIVGDEVTIRVPFDNIASISDMSFDGVTAGLRVNESVHAPLLCVVDVFDVASGDLSLPGKISP